MNGFDLTASLFQSLTSVAWPAAIVACVYLFRERLIEILPRLQLRHKDTEISFQIEEAKEEAKHLPVPADDTNGPTEEETGQLIELARVSPEQVILRRWADLERKIAETANAYEAGASIIRRRSSLQTMRQLKADGLIKLSLYSTYDDLRSIRNRLAHGDFTDAPTMKDALSYSRLTDLVIAALGDTPSLEELDAATL